MRKLQVAALLAFVVAASEGLAQCPSSGPSLRTPLNNATGVTNPVELRWERVNHPAATYAVYVGIDGATPARVASTTDDKLQRTMSGSTIDWYVDAVVTGCTPASSARSRFTMASSACPQREAPRTIAPPAGATGVASPVNFQWTTVTGATSYRVFASVNNGAIAVVGTSATNQLSVAMPQGSVRWTVEALFANGCPSTISDRSEFSIASGAACATVPPQLLTPPNGSSTASPVEFKWSPVPGASSYEVYVAIGVDSFTEIAETRLPVLSQTLPPGDVQWYVEAKLPGCNTLKSSTGRFTVTEGGVCTTVTVTPTLPANGSSVVSPVAFTWTTLPGATAYRLWVALNGGAPALVARATESRASVPLPSGAVEWFVEALRDNCPAAVSSRSRVTVQQNANCGTAPGPVPIAPVSTGGVAQKVGESVTFKWGPSSAAIGYRVWISRGGSAFADLGITTATQITRDLDEAEYTWYVEALFAGCPSALSARASFIVDDQRDRCTTVAPLLLSPAASTQVAGAVTFAWSSLEEAKLYRVYASLNGAAPILIGVAPETTLTRTLPPGSFTWIVEAVFEECPSTRSHAGQFTIGSAATCRSEAPQLLSPTAGATESAQPITFSWTQLSNALRYIVMVQNVDGSATPIADTTEAMISRRVPPGTWDWWVIAVFAGCPATESAHQRFTVPRPGGCDARPPSIVAPGDDAVTTSPVTFSWTPVAGAKAYRVRLKSDSSDAAILAVVTGTQVVRELPPGRIRWYVEATFESCPSLESGAATLSIAPPQVTCTLPRRPLARVIGQALSDTTYTLRWLPVAGASLYEVQEAPTSDFARATTQTVEGASMPFSHSVVAPSRFYYRVRAVSACSDDRGQYSHVLSTSVMPPRVTGSQRHASAEAGTSASIGQKVFLPGSSSPVTFTAAIDKPWLTVTPSSGTIGSEGLTLTVSANPTSLSAGTSTGTVTVVYGTAGKGVGVHATTSVVVPISVSLVTPVLPIGKNTPPPDSFIIPAVAHAEGANSSMFESDIRVANLSAQAIRYQLNFTPSNVDGTTTGSSTTIEVAAGATMALDDILANFFGASSSAATGSLEIRPMASPTATTSLYTTVTPSTQLATVASSRTYNSTPTGTFGQFIPAIQYSQFIGRSATAAKTILSLQQVAQSTDYRTNLGLVEGSGEPAEVLLSVYDNANRKLGEIPVSLMAGEHRQLNAVLATNNISLPDGRIEVEVTSATGKVTAYASVLDNKTSDPLLVSPVLRTSPSATRYTLPGVADLVTSANWRTDVRIFNAGSGAVDATLTFYPQGNPGATVAQTMSIAGGEVKAIDNVLQSLFGISNAGGSVVVTTPTPSNLVATARTYNLTSTGTYGQFIPGVTPAESTGLGGRSLQLLQLEQSTRFRTNVGVAETSGAAATVEILASNPDSKVSARVEIPLAAHEFRQISLSSFPDFAVAYNARVSVKVVSGSGKVTAYGSVIDMQTQDPTYVPAQ